MKERSLFLKTRRLVLKNIEEKDREMLYAIFKNKNIARTYMLPDFNEKTANELFKRLIDLSNNPKRFVYGIFLDNLLIGFMNDCSIENDDIEMGYVLNEDYWNHGYMSEAFDRAIEELFECGYEKIEAAFFEKNIASKRVMEKCGLKASGKSEYIEYRGKQHLCIYYEIRK